MITTPLRTASISGSLGNRVQLAAQSLNQSASHSTQPGKRKAGQERREDRVQLNPMKQVQNMIDHLMEQKQNLIEQKNQLIADTLAGGGDVSSIQALVSLYDEQISNIDTQISQTMKDMIERQLEKKEEKEGKDPETKEEQQIRQLNKLSSISMDYEQVNQVYRAHGQKKREANIMAQEIKMDNSRGGVASGKNERLADVLEEADQLYKEAIRGYVNLNVVMKEDEKEELQDQKQLERQEEESEEGLSADSDYLQKE